MTGVIVFLISDRSSTRPNSRPSGRRCWHPLIPNGNVSEWYFFTGKKFTADVRYNIDDENTVTACGGKQFGKDAFSVIPEICGYAGRRKGLGPEVWILSETKKLSLSSYVQYARLRDENSFGYFWLEGEGKVSKHFQPGLASETEKDVGQPPRLDIGVAAKFIFGRFGVNAYPLWTVTPNGRGDTHIRTGLSYSF